MFHLQLGHDGYDLTTCLEWPWLLIALLIAPGPPSESWMFVVEHRSWKKNINTSLGSGFYQIQDGYVVDFVCSS